MPKTTLPTAYYFYRLLHDHFISELVVVNSADPHQQVDSVAPDGTRQRWAKRVRGDEVVFTPPDGYAGGPIGWLYDPRCQRGEPAPLKTLQREALFGRVSVSF